jgi:multisubunit Na+/H+ antiporter MnhB subunit
MTNSEKSITQIRLSMKKQKIYFWLAAGSLFAGMISTLIIVIIPFIAPSPGKGYYWFIIPAISLVLFYIFFKKEKKENKRISTLL